MMEEEKSHGEALLGWVSQLRDGISNLDKTAVHLKSLDTYLHELEAVIRIFTDKTVQGIVLVQDSKYIWANRAACYIFGYGTDEVLTQGPAQTTLPHLRDKYLAREKLVLAGDIIEMPQEWPVLRKDRTIRYVNSFSYRVTIMLKPALLVFFYDVTESRKIQDELLVRAQILDAVSDAILLMELSGRIVYTNEASCGLTGYTREELLGMGIQKLSAPEFMNRLNIRLTQFSEHKESRYKALSVRKDGARILIEVRGRIIWQAGKQFLLAVAREMKIKGSENELDTNTEEGKS